MSQIKLASNVALNAVAAQAAVALSTTPFPPGRDKINARIDVAGMTGAPTVKIQGAGSDLVYVDLATFTPASNSDVQTVVTAYPNMRANVTVAGTAGTYSITLFD